MSYFKDLTEDDEANMPLPSGWIRAISMSNKQNGQKRLYKNLKTGLESEEHPFIVQALNMARGKALPVGWIVKEVKFDDGTNDFVYYNNNLGISMWDPPLLRDCLRECLAVHGFSDLFLNITQPKQQQYDNDIDARYSSIFNDNNNSAYATYDDEHSSHFECENRDQYYDNNNDEEEDEESVMISYHNAAQWDNPPPSTSFDSHHHDKKDQYSPQQEHYSPHQSSMNSVHEAQSECSEDTNDQNHDTTNARDWEQLLQTYTDKNSDFTDKITHRIRKVRPPVTQSGIHVLRHDVMEANERTHHLLLKLRSTMLAKAGIKCSFLYYVNKEDVDEFDAGAALVRKMERRQITLVSDIVTTLKQSPEFVVLAMAATDKASSSSMVHIAFTVLHRILHPFSTDSSMTTAILLQGINYQLDEMTLVEKIFSDMDSKRILSRALFVSDPVQAIQWDPLTHPLPVSPVVSNETVLTCLLRVYAIRRDVTSYYRAIWKPVIPSIISVFNATNVKGPHVFANLVSVASRLLECTFSERSILVLPATATAVCRAMNEIGGHNAMHTYLLNLLVLPNLVKILAGDHESAENESMLSAEMLHTLTTKYFDTSLWFDVDGGGGNSDQQQLPASLNPLCSMIWVIWRMYSYAVYLRGSKLTILTTKQFAGNRFPAMDISGVPDAKLKNIVARLQRKLDKCCEFLVKLPLDAQGSEYLGVDTNVDTAPLLSSYQHGDPVMAKLLDKRLTSLYFKPNEMLNLTVLSKQDIGSLFTDVAVALELNNQRSGSTLYRAISEYLLQCDNINETNNFNRAEFMQLTFLYNFNSKEPAGESKSDMNYTDSYSLYNDVEEEFGTTAELEDRYSQLVRGLQLANRYEDALISMIHRFENGVSNSVFDLLSGSSAAATNSPPVEFDRSADYDSTVKSDIIRLATVHTKGSVKKVKPSNFGLQEPVVTRVMPLFSNASTEDHHPGRKSLKEMNDEYFKSYRFGSTASSVGVGTSMARDKLLAPKVKPNAVSVTTAKVKASVTTNNHRSKYTKVSIKSDSSILAPTASLKTPTFIPENLQQIDKTFMKSMREHSVIPTEQFQSNYRKHIEQRRVNDYVVRNLSKRSIRTVPVSVAQQQQNYNKTPSRKVVPPPRSSASMIPGLVAAQPFPDHLRHRVRGTPQYDTERFDPDIVEEQMQISDVINAYHNVFNDSGKPKRTMSRTSSGHRLAYKEAKPSSLPTPIMNANYFAPTASVLWKMHEGDGQTVKSTTSLHASHLRAMHDGATPGLRSYKPTSDFSAPPFIPTKARVYEPTGPRVARVPEFLLYGSTGNSFNGSSSIRSNRRGDEYTHQYGSSPDEQYQQQQQQQFQDLQDEEDDRYEESEEYQQQQQFGESPVNNSHNGREYDDSGEYSPLPPQYPQYEADRYDNNMDLGVSSPDQQQHQQLPRTSFMSTNRNTASVETNNPSVNVALQKPQQTAKPQIEHRDARSAGLQRGNGKEFHLPVEATEQPAVTVNPAKRRQSSIVIETNGEVMNNVTRTGGVVPLRQNTAYCINFQNAEEGHHRYDSNVDRDIAEERRRMESVFGDEKEFDDDVEDEYCGEPRYITDAAGRAVRVNFLDMDGNDYEFLVNTRDGGLPLIKSKNFIADHNRAKQMFIRGFLAMKHGRQGGPKQKLVLFNEDEHTIEWTSAGMTKRQSLTKLFSSKNVTEITNSVRIEDITEVRRGIQTDVLFRANLVDPLCCFSIVTEQRSLDLTLSNNISRDMAIRGLQAILKDYSSDVPFL